MLKSGFTGRMDGRRGWVGRRVDGRNGACVGLGHQAVFAAKRTRSLRECGLGAAKERGGVRAR